MTAVEKLQRLQWSPGRPDKFWDRNCLSLAGGRFEPLESTGLHLVQTGISRFLKLFPVCRFSPQDLEEYNRLAIEEHERIRDFLILHYKATRRDDSPFWNHCREMQIPDTLRARMELFERCGRISVLDEEHFALDSWLAVLLGQGVRARDYDPLADVLATNEAREALLCMRAMISDSVSKLTTLSQFVRSYCWADSRDSADSRPRGGPR